MADRHHRRRQRQRDATNPWLRLVRPLFPPSLSFSAPSEPFSLDSFPSSPLQVAVDYPATLSDYAASEAQGVEAMQGLLESYAAACPGSKVVLMGYSQVRLFSLLLPFRPPHRQSKY